MPVVVCSNCGTKNRVDPRPFPFAPYPLPFPPWFLNIWNALQVSERERISLRCLEK